MYPSIVRIATGRSERPLAAYKAAGGDVPAEVRLDAVAKLDSRCHCGGAHQPVFQERSITP